MAWWSYRRVDPGAGSRLSGSAGASAGWAGPADRNAVAGQLGALLVGRQAEPGGDRPHVGLFVDVEAPQGVPVDRRVPVPPGEPKPETIVPGLAITAAISIRSTATSTPRMRGAVQAGSSAAFTLGCRSSAAAVPTALAQPTEWL